MTKIWQGPVSTSGQTLWYGLERGASLAGLAATTTTNGVTTPSPFPIAVSWLGTWLQQNPNWNWPTLTYAQFDQLFAQSVREFSATIATDNPDLSAFRNHGGKILIWHGLADQLIFPQGPSTTTSASSTRWAARRARIHSPGCSWPPARSTAPARSARPRLTR